MFQRHELHGKRERAHCEGESGPTNSGLYASQLLRAPQGQEIASIGILYSTYILGKLRAREGGWGTSVTSGDGSIQHTWPRYLLR